MKKLYRVLLYLTGLFVLALGIALNANTGLGASPIVSVSYCVSNITGINIGNATLGLYLVFIALQLVLLGRPLQWAALLQLPLSLIFTRFLNLFDSVLPHNPQNPAAALGMLAAAIVLTGIGLSMSVNMRLIPNPGDGIVAAVCRRFGKELGLGKNIIDGSCVLVSFVLGLIFGRLFCGIGIGTVAAMVATGRVVALFNRFAACPMQKAAGLTQ